MVEKELVCQFFHFILICSTLLTLLGPIYYVTLFSARDEEMLNWLFSLKCVIHLDLELRGA